MSPRRQQLRAATAATHAALDSAFQDFSSPGRYRAYLAAQLAYRPDLEAALGASEWRPAGYAPTLIADDLAEDALSLGIPGAGIHPGPAGDGLPESRSAWLGLAYVLEGSCFGARVLLGRAERLGFTADHGARHLVRQAAAGAWPDLLRELDEAPCYDAEAAAGAARAAFAIALSASREAALERSR